MNTLTLIRWAGGKGRQLNDLLPLIPDGRTYVEPFGGGASVLLNRQRSDIEVYNDLDGALVNLFTVVRGDDSFAEFQRLVDYTLYSRDEFERCLSFEGIADSVRRAVAFYTVINQSISGKRLASKGDWSRGRLDNLAQRWVDRQRFLDAIHGRVRGVQIECRDALDVIEEWDGDDTVFYCDPPYVLETRSQRKYYAIEPGDEYHERLVDVLLRTRGSIVLSGYNHPVYERLVEAGWWSDLYGSRAVMEVTQAKGQKQKRTEIVYRNQRACDQGIKRPLFTAQDIRGAPQYRGDGTAKAGAQVEDVTTGEVL